MEKKEFYTLLSNYTSLSAEETDQVISLQEKFPYSQVIHCLAARATLDNQFTDKDYQLNISAIYSTDRAVLKSIMTSLKQSRTPIKKVETPKPEQKVITEGEVVEALVSAPTKENPILPSASQSDTVSNASFYLELQHDLEVLKERKHQFENAVSNFENGIPLVEGTKNKRGKMSDPDEGLLKEIKSSKKKIKPEDPKQKEQIEIIDQFIKAQPTIKNKLAKESTSSKEDLIEKDLTYGENIVSETLVDILLKQGKKEKAIEVLKKLIWKFPQKKTYFAAQIEDLKK